MLIKLTLGVAIVAAAALLTPVSAAPPGAQTLATAPQQAQGGVVEQVHWRHRHRHRHWHHRHGHHHHWHHRHWHYGYRHCRRVWHWTPYRGWHWHRRCHWH
jgi:hypothetical protein